MLNINEDDLKKAIVEQATDQLLSESDDLSSMVRQEVKTRLDKIFAGRAEAQIKSAIDEAIQSGFEREYQRVTSWGEPEGEKTSIKKSLEKIVGAYWSANVDPRSGKESSSSYNNVTRAEYIMTTVCADKFSETMKANMLNIAGHLKDGLRNQLAAHMDNMLSELFHVKSLQDQGKVEKPY